MPLVALTGDMGWLPTHARHMFILLKMYMQLEENTCNPITQYAYKQSTQLALLGKHTWSWYCKTLMCGIKGHCTILNNNSLSDLQVAIHTIAYEEWCSQLHKPPDSSSESGGKLFLYKELQSEPLPAGYVLADISPGRRWVMAAIRGGCLPIAIETGRFQTPKVPLNDRLCINCNQHAIEDIPHFILFCTRYHVIRLELFNFIVSKFPSFYSLHVKQTIQLILLDNLCKSLPYIFIKCLN